MSFPGTPEAFVLRHHCSIWVMGIKSPLRHHCSIWVETLGGKVTCVFSLSCIERMLVQEWRNLGFRCDDFPF